MTTSMDAYGLNLFAYCGNDPVNRADPSGYLPDDRLIQNAVACNNGTGAFYMLGCYNHSHFGRYSWYKLKQFGLSALGGLVEIMSCVELTGGVGVGIGASVEVGPLTGASAEASVNLLNVEMNNTEGIAVGVEGSASLGVTVLGFDYGNSYEEYHSYDCQNCTVGGCYVDKGSIYDPNGIFNISVGAYLGVGGSLGISIDVNRFITLLNEDINAIISWGQ